MTYKGAYGHLNVVDNQPAIAAGRGQAQLGGLPAAGRAHGLYRTGAVRIRRRDRRSRLQAARDPRALGLTPAALAERGWARLELPRPYAPFARGEFPTPSGKVRVFSQRLAEQGHEPLPCYVPPHESPLSNPDSPPAIRWR